MLVQEGDKIGFTYPDERGTNPIAVSRNTGAVGANTSPTSDYGNSTLPEVGGVYNFSDSPYNFLFSIAVDIDTGKVS